MCSHALDIYSLQLQERVDTNSALTEEQKELTLDRIKDLNRVLLKLKQNINIIEIILTIKMKFTRFLRLFIAENTSYNALKIIILLLKKIRNQLAKVN